MRARLTALVLLAAACLYTYQLEIPETRTRPASDVDRLTLEAVNGAVEVAASTDSIATVLVTRYASGRDSVDAARAIGNVVVTDTFIGGTWNFEADIPSGGRPYGVTYDAACRAKTEVGVSTSNGAVQVSGMTGGVTVRTSNGAVHLTGTEGPADIVTTNGAVSLQVHRGPAEIVTTNGSVSCDIALLNATEDASISTSNGSVALLLPADVSATVDVTTTNNGVTITGFAQIQYLEQTQNHVKAKIGSGASTVNITTTNAAVSVRPRS